MTRAAWKIRDQFRLRTRQETAGIENSISSDADHAAPSRVASQPEPSDNDFERIWDEEWMKDLQRAGLEKLRSRLTPRQFQIFHAYVVEKWPVKKVKEVLGASFIQSYLAKSRHMEEFEKAIRETETERT